jgi:hypothetical protein
MYHHPFWSAACPESFEGRLACPACPGLRGELRRAAAFMTTASSPNRPAALATPTPPPKRSPVHKRIPRKTSPHLPPLLSLPRVPPTPPHASSSPRPTHHLSSRPECRAFCGTQRWDRGTIALRHPISPSRAERPDFLFRAALWRFGPRSRGIPPPPFSSLQPPW